MHTRPRGHGLSPLQAVESFQTGGDREGSFRLLFNRYHQPLCRFFARKGLRPEICRDLTQETFLEVYRGLETYEPRARFETWLYRLATTTYLKHRRASARAKRAGDEISVERAEEAGHPIADAGRQLERMLANEQRRILHRAVCKLPERMRSCLELKLYRELRCSEIATALQVSIGTVKAHLFQARGKLRRELTAPWAR